jgi:uncharacterized membrane protein SpoIIM required for sporulation
MPGRKAVIAALITLALGIVCGVLMDRKLALTAMDALRKHLSGIQFSFPGIFLNNLESALAIAAGGFFFAVPSVALAFVNFLAIGVSWQVITADHSPLYFFALIAPHGILEIPAIVIALAAAFTLAGGAFRQVFRKQAGKFHPAFVRFLRTYAFVVVPLLVAAAFVETNVTPAIFRRVTGG